MKPRLLLTLPISPNVMERFQDEVEFVSAPGRSPDQIRAAAQNCDGIIVRVPLPQDICDAAPSVRVIARHGAGLDMIPVDAATRANVPVVNVPGVNARSVAEHGLMQMLRLARNEHVVSGTLSRTGGWEEARTAANQADELQGRTAGIIGLGNVGRALAHLLQGGFDMQVLGTGRAAGTDLPDGVTGVPLDELVSRSDFIILCVPLTPGTCGMINAALLGRVKPGARLVNLARGGVTVEADVAAALRDGTLAGAAIDVFETQPLPDGHPFWDCPNLLISPHIAGASRSSMSAMGNGAIGQCLQVLRGERPAHLVNPEVWETRR